MGILLGAIIGIAVGAVALGVAVNGGVSVPGLSIALSHIPSTVHGYAVVSTVKASVVGGAGGGVIGTGIAAAAKGAGAAAHAPA